MLNRGTKRRKNFQVHVTIIVYTTIIVVVYLHFCHLERFGLKTGAVKSMSTYYKKSDALETSEDIPEIQVKQRHVIDTKPVNLSQ